MARVNGRDSQTVYESGGGHLATATLRFIFGRREPVVSRREPVIGLLSRAER